ncbi:hypothetical protein SAMN04488490_0947 [Marinobacter sp. LV10R510-11A]|uniref:hypothetical protein n=1 Tax=Marinobacter sp. LV10R510-11A TaxID=1415568 RepID=UPI000BB79A14|nr:hypothetical protein [Marinobacter sp. LV10R510-11A]SOB75364.1 hypothetical protein SAMN04488490_0947 [Marinobacter sp. LV10R510-11A]
MKTETYETVYNRYIRNARKATRGLAGFERAKAIQHYFCYQTNRDRMGWSFPFDQMAMNRSSDYQFAIDVMTHMAHQWTSNDVNTYP